MRTTTMRKVSLVFMLAISAYLSHAVFAMSSSLNIEMKYGETRCFREDFPPSTHILGEYAVADVEGHMSLNLRIRRTHSPVSMFMRDDITKGTISMTTSDHESKQSEPYDICVMHHIRPDDYRDIKARRKFHIQFRWGSQAVDYATMAKKEHWDDIRTAVKRLQNELEDVLGELDEMHAREKTLSNANEMLHAHVTYFSILSCAILVITGVYQRWYIMRFFKSKRLY